MLITVIYKIHKYCIHFFLINCSVTYWIFYPKVLDSETKLLYIEVWFTDQNSNPLEVEDKVNITLVINKSMTYNRLHAIQFNIGKKISKSLNSKYSRKLLDNAKQSVTMCICLKFLQKQSFKKQQKQPVI